MTNAAKKQTAAKDETAKTNMTVVKTEQKATESLPLDKRIQRVEDLSMLIDKWRKLTETRRNLETFNLGADGMGATVFLRDAGGKEFKTSNSPVVAAVTEEIKSTLDAKIKEVEAQIQF